MAKNRLDVRNEFVTRFWQKAFESLPGAIRARHAFHMKSAERWELRLDAAIELWSRAAAALAKVFQVPRRSPNH